MIWGQVNLDNMSKAGKPPMKQSKNSVLTCEIVYVMFWQVIIMLMATVWQAFLGLCERARWTDSACCRTTVGGKLNQVLATR
jgi:hypothetical protein